MQLLGAVLARIYEKFDALAYQHTNLFGNKWRDRAIVLFLD
jgi:hypothetical protein